MTTLKLVKGQREKVSAQKFNVGLGWDVNSSDENPFDLDASILMLGSNGKLVSDAHCVYFGQLQSPNGSVIHNGDNLTGEGDGDDEVISIDLSKIEAGVEQLMIVVNIYQGASRRQNFGQVRNAFVRIVDNGGQELMKYELSESFSIQTGVEFGRLYKHGEDWKFEAIGMGAEADLQHYIGKYR